MAINKFGATNNNWGTATNWSQGTVPTASDGHVTTFDATSPNCTVDTSNRVCNNIDFTGYINTITMSFQITVSGNVILESTMNVSGTGKLRINANGNLTSDGYVWPNDLELGGTSTNITLLDNWSITGSLNLVGTGTNTINGFQITANGLNSTVSSTTNTGTTNYILTGGTWGSITATAVLRNNITLSGNVTIGGTSTTLAYNTGTLTYSSGMITVVATTFSSSGSTGFSTGSAVVFNNLTFGTSSAVMTLGADLYVSGILSTGSATTSTFNGAFRIYVSGGLTISNSGNWGGTLTEMILDGSGTITGSGSFRVNLTINTAGTIVMPTTFDFGGTSKTLKYTAGTVDTTTNSTTFNISLASCILECSGITWVSLLWNIAGTITLNQNVNFTGTATLGVGSSTTTLNGSQLIASSNAIVNCNVTTGIVNGTTVIKFTGNNTFQMSSVTTGATRNPLEINTSGTFSLGTNVNYNTGTITYVQGTISFGIHTMTIGNVATTITVNGAGCTFPSIITTANTTFNGTNGCAITTWTCTSASTGLIHTFKSGNTYSISNLTCMSTAASPKLLTSDSAGVQANIVFPQGSTMDIGYTNVTDINSSGGITAWTYKGVLSNATNWRQIPVQPGIASSTNS